ncbi:MAG: hypothetical protein JSV21_03425 [Nitrospirota bacterium]|nr:MAG: hypothetical protein JSV21_03425 [Nitrospirota bacterium]
MKHFFIVVLTALISISFAAAAIGAEMKEGTIKGIDMEKGTIVFCPAGTKDEMTMEVAGTVNLKKFKTDMKVKAFVEEKDGKMIVKGLKPSKRVVQGC